MIYPNRIYCVSLLLFSRINLRWNQRMNHFFEFAIFFINATPHPWKDSNTKSIKHRISNLNHVIIYFPSFGVSSSFWCSQIGLGLFGWLISLSSLASAASNSFPIENIFIFFTRTSCTLSTIFPKHFLIFQFHHLWFSVALTFHNY